MSYLKGISILVLMSLLYQDVIRKLVMDWLKDPNYSHGFLIPAISLYLVWQKKSELRHLNMTKEPGSAGLLIMFMGLVMLTIGRSGSELFLQRFSLVVIITGLVWLFFGRRILKTSSPALAFLIFMIPIPYILYDAIAFPLKLFATFCATTSLALLDIPVLREGNIIYLANTTLEVADACSGIRSLFSLLALGTFLAFITSEHYLRRIAIILLVFPIAILTNAGRVIGTGILAHFYDSRVAEGFFHEFSGLLIFLTASLLLGIFSRIIASR